MTSATATPQTFRELFAGAPSWLKGHVPRVIVATVSAGVVGYVSNVWIMAVRYQGTADVPAGAPATASGNVLSGALFWALAGSVVTGVVGYRQAAGKERFWREARGLPRTLAALVRHDGADARVHLLWGASAALLAGLVVPPALAGVTALAVLAAAPTVLGSIIATSLSRAWSAVVRPLGPSAPRPAGMGSMLVGLIGSGLALSAGMVLPGTDVRLALALALGALAMLASKRATPTGAAVVILLFALVASAVDVLFAGMAWADDGGFAECSASWSQWLRSCGGSAAVRHDSVAGALAAAVGAPVGGFLGSLLGSLPGIDQGGEPWRGVGPDMPSPEGEPEWESDGPLGLLRLPETIADPQWLFETRPRAWASGGRLTVRGAGGVLVSAPLGPDGSLTGPWEYAGEDRPPPMTRGATSRGGPAEPDPGDGEGGVGTGEAGDGDPVLDMVAAWIADLLGGETDGTDPFQPEEPPARESDQLPPVDELTRRLNALGSWSWTALDDPAVAQSLQDQVDGFYDRVRSGPFDATMLRDLEGIEARQDQIFHRNTERILADQRQWGDEQLREARERLHREGWRTEEEIASDADIARGLAAQLRGRQDYIRNHIADLPGNQGEIAGRLLDGATSRIGELVSQGKPPDAESIDIIRRLSGSIFNTTTGMAEAEGAEAQGEAADAQLAGDLSRAVQVGLTAGVGGGALVGGLSMAAPTYAAAMNLAAPTMTAAQLGAGMYGFGVATGAAEGYGSGETYGGHGYSGVQGAIVGAARNALPVNLVSQVIEETQDPDATGLGSAWRIGVATVRDIGNVAGAGDAAEALGTVGRAAQGSAAAVSRGPTLGSGEPMPPRAGPTDVDLAARAAQQQGQVRAENFGDAVDALHQARVGGDPGAIAAAEETVRRQAVHIAADPNARNVLKNSAPRLQDAYTDSMGASVFKPATEGFVERANAAGYQVGGRPMRPEDWLDLRNAGTRGSVPMDRDLAANEMRLRQVATQLEGLPGAPAPGSVDALVRDQLQDELSRLQRTTQLTRNGEPVTMGSANEHLQGLYSESFQEVTAGIVGGPGYTGEEALQGVTQMFHREAYRDLPVLGFTPGQDPGDFSRLLDPRWAEQTGSVTSIKAAENLHAVGLGSTPELREANAIAETARGVVKDINTKLEPVLLANGASPEAVARTRDIRAFLTEVKDGRMYPSDAQRIAAERFGTNIQGLADQAASNLAAAIAHGPVGMPPPAAAVGVEGLGSGSLIGGTQAGLATDQLEREVEGGRS